MELRSSDLSAKLLATENLNVVRARTGTAAFDIKSRTLILPIWKDMTPEIEEMLVGHEIGHALYTGEDYLKPINENPKMKSYMNVLEDVRIEKLIKRKYPGLRKRMAEGYKQLNDRDFFGVKRFASLETLNLIDRINLYYKAGFNCGVSFTAEEKLLVVAAERTETMQDVIDLANQIYEFSKKSIEERMEESSQSVTVEDTEDEEDEDVDYVDADDLLEDEEYEMNPDAKVASSGEHKVNPKDSEASEEDLESQTDDFFHRKLSELADTDTIYNYWKLDQDYSKDVVIGYQRILKETQLRWSEHPDHKSDPSWVATHKTYDDVSDKNYDKFKIESTRTVNYLVKEFEMKKSATLYKRAQTSKIGSLDMSKVWSYKLSDDLFKRVTTLPMGKNHGMVFLLDWSGSMDNVIQDTLKQVINLAMFCQRVQIPFRVLAFTTNYCERNYEERQNYIARDVGGAKKLLANTSQHMNLLELFSSKMTTSEFHSMAKRVIDFRFLHNKNYSMAGTPLNEALGWIYFNLGTYIKENNIEKLSLITLTDGEGSSLKPIAHNLSLSDRILDPRTYKYVKQKHFLTEEVSKKTYEISQIAGTQTDVLLRMIKDRYNIMTVGFYISRNSRRDLGSAIRAYYPDFKGNDDLQIEEWRKQFKDIGFASMPNTGRDEMFLIPQSSTKIDDGSLEVDADAKASSIARSFGKYLNVKRTSRVLLNRFVEIVA